MTLNSEINWGWQAYILDPKHEGFSWKQSANTVVKSIFDKGECKALTLRIYEICFMKNIGLAGLPVKVEWANEAGHW